MKVIVEASPNIAFMKYWGKLPAERDWEKNRAVNSSLSLTLSHARTRTAAERAQREEFHFNGEPANSMDQEKMRRHAERVWDWAASQNLVSGPRPTLCIRSENNFPASAGLASSASAFAALTLALLGAYVGPENAENLLKTHAAELSTLARRASGSACRSLAGPFCKWEATGQADEHARVLPLRWQLRDTIVILSRQAKAVSSSEAHERIRSSPRFEPRLRQLPLRLSAMECALERHDLRSLGLLLEEEALDIHRVAESSQPPIRYRSPETLLFLAALQAQNERDFFFTLDAGPNVHVISERPVRKELEALLQELEITAEIWEDEAGTGPRFVQGN